MEWGRVKSGPGLLGNYVTAIDLSSTHNLPPHATYRRRSLARSKLLR